MYDVVIAGAGPAGTACALALSRHGRRVALVERLAFPRDKVCGDAIPGAAYRHLRRLGDELGVPLPRPRPHADVKHARFFGDGPHALRVSWHVPAFNATRVAFDRWLYEAVAEYTATDLLPGRRITDVRVGPDRVAVATSAGALSAKLVVGCDGAHSAVARALTATRLDRRHHLAAVRAYYRGVGGGRRATNDFYFLRRWQPGYLWVFPAGGGLWNVGFGMASDAIAARRVDLRATLAEVLAEHPRLRWRFAGAEQVGRTVGFGLPTGSRTVPASGERFLLCGDAASLIDPLGGHGIDKAVESGVLAAEQADWCLRRDRYAAADMQPYEDALARRIRPTLRRNGRVVRLGTAAPWLLDAALGLDRVPGLTALAQRWL